MLRSLVPLAALAALAASFRPSPAPARRHRPPGGTPVVEARVDPRLVTANTQFGFKLVGELWKKGHGHNTFVSPTSITLAVAMLYNGTGGATRQAIARTLGIEGMSPADVNRANAALRAGLANPESSIQLSIANSMWARKGKAFKPEFLRTNQEFYGAELAALPAEPSPINAWVKRQTRGKIDRIIDRIDPLTVLILVNAIYFKGNWTDKFDPKQTKARSFTLLNGRQKQHPMMAQSGSFRYYQGSGFQAIRLPYGERRMSMYVFLPDKSSSLQAFQRSLTAANWESWISRFREAEVDLVMPRFKAEYEVVLNDALKALGMGAVFTPGTDFTAMFVRPEEMRVDEVKHKTFVEVNEEGTEAAAATSIGLRATAMPIAPEKVRMIVDRPFFCAIRDDVTGTVLFMGSIVDPQ